MQISDLINIIFPLNVGVFKDSTKKSIKTIFCGTGFIYESKKKLYLVTALNVVTGRNIITGSFITQNEYMPDVIFIKTPSAGKKKQQSIILNLYDENDNPCWLIHPKYKRNLDIAVIPLENIPPNLQPLNLFNDEKSNSLNNIKIIGYPLFLAENDKGTNPVLETVSIVNDCKKIFYIDNISQKGMFGAPVFDYEECLDSVFIRFLGICSGNEKAENKSPLPVWKTELLEDIIKSGIKDSSYL